MKENAGEGVCVVRMGWVVEWKWWVNTAVFSSQVGTEGTTVNIDIFAQYTFSAHFAQGIRCAKN